jgi:cysteine synthase B
MAQCVRWMHYPTIEDAIGKTPLVALQRIGAAENSRAAT